MTLHVTTRKNGQFAESLAEKHLESHGLKFQCRNYRMDHSQEEIDLIMMEDNTLVFVEVRSRSDCRHGHPLSSITLQKQQKIIKAAKHYLLKNGLYDKVACRFDVISIVPSAENWQLEWIRDAFRAYS